MTETGWRIEVGWSATLVTSSVSTPVSLSTPPNMGRGDSGGGGVLRYSRCCVLMPEVPPLVAKQDTIGGVASR